MVASDRHGRSREALNLAFPEIGHANDAFMTQVQLMRKFDTLSTDEDRSCNALVGTDVGFRRFRSWRD